MKPFNCLRGKHQFTDAKAELQPVSPYSRTLVCEKCYHLIITDTTSVAVLEASGQYHPSVVTKKIEREKMRERMEELASPGFVRGYMAMRHCSVEEAMQEFRKVMDASYQREDAAEINQLIREKKYLHDSLNSKEQTKEENK